ncbi:hypothetical protein HMPREF9098_0823 [Kingella denitrificans ATCC 33394]|uniref:Uncharacterized protein n=1 Tax=Kingella denitrificans ATCC 33394 TaxID=888741 RepID=F0EY89_9NEIS|nr:hypothetical protein HMPREF9098_0823 [Kingella denitrificans ATCC 33394]
MKTVCQNCFEYGFYVCPICACTRLFLALLGCIVQASTYCLSISYICSQRLLIRRSLVRAQLGEPYLKPSGYFRMAFSLPISTQQKVQAAFE